MRVQQFRTVIAAGPGGRAIVVVPFDPDRAWGAKAEHPVKGVPPLDRCDYAPAGRPCTRIAEVTSLLAAGIKQRPRS
jgi:hypothetical protein